MTLIPHIFYYENAIEHLQGDTRNSQGMLCNMNQFHNISHIPLVDFVKYANEHYKLMKEKMVPYKEKQNY